MPTTQNLLGTAHFTVTYRYGCHESLVGRYATKAEALAVAKEYRAELGVICTVRFCKF